jgi:hypothetical protein
MATLRAAAPPYRLARKHDAQTFAGESAASAPPPRTTGGYASTMRGDLAKTSAADACRDLARRRLTGALEVVGPDGPGRIVFVEGRVTAAVSPTPRARLGDRLVGAGLLEDDALTTALRMQADEPGRARLGALLVERGLVARAAVRLFVQEQLLDALFEINGWRYGSFGFTAGRGVEVPEIPLSLSVDDALVEVSRRQREWAELSQLIPDLEAVPVFPGRGSSTVASLEPDEFAVLASIDDDRSIRELATDLGYGDFEAARIVYGLALLGVVEVRLPEDEVGAALDEALAYFVEPPGAGEEAAVGAEAEDGEAGSGAGDEPSDGAGSDGTEQVPAELASTLDLPPDGLDEDDLGTILTSLRDEPHPGARATGHDGDAAAASEPAPEPAEPEPAEHDAAAASGDDDGRAPRQGPVSGGDVSEFLRELSRLAIDEPPPRREPPPPSPRTDAPPARSAPAEDRKKKRGLFGWGG